MGYRKAEPIPELNENEAFLRNPRFVLKVDKDVYALRFTVRFTPQAANFSHLIVVDQDRSRPHEAIDEWFENVVNVGGPIGLVSLFLRDPPHHGQSDIARVSTGGFSVPPCRSVQPV